MRFSSFLFLLYLTGCAASNKNSYTKTGKLTKIIFENYTEIHPVNSKSNLEFRMADFIVNGIPATELIIEINKDTVWKYTKENGKIIGDYQRIDKENGIIYWHAKRDKSILYKNFNLFALKNDYIIQEFPDSIKSILGYNCFKVRMERIEKDTSEHSSGNTIYEMYVTKKIKLPVHVLINIGYNIPKYFPLEVKMWEAKLEKFTEHFNAKKIIFISYNLHRSPLQFFFYQR